MSTFGVTKVMEAKVDAEHPVVNMNVGLIPHGHEFFQRRTVRDELAFLKEVARGEGMRASRQFLTKGLVVRTGLAVGEE